MTPDNPTIPAPRQRRAQTLTSRGLVRRYALDCATRTRPQAGLTRVSQEFLDAVETNTRTFIANRIHRAPSRGKTLH